MLKLRINWKSQIWNLVFAGGALIGGFIATNFLSDSNGLDLSLATVIDLSELGISFNGWRLYIWSCD
jgi:hypothetical protein